MDASSAAPGEPHASPPEAHCRFRVGPVDPAWVLESVQQPEAGCVNLFMGTVRRGGVEGEVIALRYQAYESMATDEFHRIATKILQDFEVRSLAMEHALGEVPLGQCSIVVAIAATHRREVFAATAAFMDAVKARLPIWKEECYRDGRRWIGKGS